jgi:2-amino-4-hydroxy-6-hydroxymethyldihydropteridine diphosphokinase
MAGIIIALGANLPSAVGRPAETFAHACAALRSRGVIVAGKAKLYRSAAVPASDQPAFLNTCIRVFTTLPPTALMVALQTIEQACGRKRRTVNEARTLDLDLIDYEGCVSDARSGALVLPHPRMSERGFVLRPMADLAPHWRHPRTGERLATLLARLPVSDDTQRVEDAAWAPFGAGS